MKTNNETPTILAAVGARGTDAKLTATTAADLSAQIGGTVNAVRLDKATAVLYSRDTQTATLIDPYALQGTIALCGIDRDGNPAALSTVKQVTKYAKLFRKNGMAMKGGE